MTDTKHEGQRTSCSKLVVANGGILCMRHDDEGTFAAIAGTKVLTMAVWSASRGKKWVYVAFTNEKNDSVTGTSRIVSGR